MTQAQTPTAPVNLTMLRPRELGLQSLLDKANTSFVAGPLALEDRNVKPVPMERPVPMESPAVPEGKVEKKFNARLSFSGHSPPTPNV